MARVWAHCKAGANRGLATFDENSRAFGFTHVKNFETLPELVRWLGSEDLGNAVEVLYINSHGVSGSDARLELDIPISMATLSHIERPLRDLMGYLTHGGKLVFSGCSTGGGFHGTQFLLAISYHVRLRKIIAFERDTIRTISRASALTGGTSVGEVYIDGARATPYSPHAKWVFFGISPQVVRYPVDEQSRRPEMRCAYPLCPGHSNPLHQCDAPWHPASEWHSALPRKPSIVGFG